MSFVFTVCQRGAETALKTELLTSAPHLTLAYSRPGFVTFKSSKPVTPDLVLPSVFARAYGVSVGRTRSLEEAVALLAPFQVHTIHAYDVDDHFPGDEPPGFVFNSRTQSLPTPASPPALGQLLGDVISVSDTEFFAGLHVHHAGHTGWPGGRPPLCLPEDAPSRAYLKFEEARLLTKADFRPGQRALEIGASPGGTALRLLELGLDYLAIDPKPLDPSLRKNYPNPFSQLTKAIEFVKPEELPATVDWILLDANVEPEVVLRPIESLTRRYATSLKGLFLTLKLNSWERAREIPNFLKLIRQFPCSRLNVLQARQLCYNRQEIFCARLDKSALTR